MNRNLIIALMILFVFISCIAIGLTIYKLNKIGGTNIDMLTEISGEKVLTKDTEEIQVNSKQEIKTSPNAKIIMKILYKKCGHTITKNKIVPENLVNLNKEEFQEQYKDYTINTFANNEIVLQKEEDGICNEHYVLRENNGNVIVYNISENGQEQVYNDTGILTKYLPEMDLIGIKNGIKVIGKDKLNKVLEDYE